MYKINLMSAVTCSWESGEKKKAIKKNLGSLYFEYTYDVYS